ncbi:MAG: RNA-binding protein [Pseudolabrys sp.]
MELDRGTTSVAPGTERSCALTRKVTPVDALIRFVVGPDGAVVPDVKRKLPGRGLWITATGSAVSEAVKRNVFARGFKRQVRAAPNLAAETERLLERAALDALAVAGKAGLVVAGAAKVADALAGDNALALIHAADAAPDGRRKLDALLQRKTPGKSRETVIVETFSGDQLDLALNRPNVVHAALLAGAGSETFLARERRLQRFRTGRLPD